jgi:hypothetical protein
VALAVLLAVQQEGKAPFLFIIKENEMPSYAVLNGNTVINKIVADSKEIAEEFSGAICIEYENIPGVFPEIGYTYDGENFNAPNEEL